MPIFQYVARDESGSLINQKVAFKDEVALRHHLRKNNLFVVEVTEVRRPQVGIKRKVRLGDLIVMARQLRTMLDAGMPLVTGLEAFADQCTNPFLGEIMGKIARAVGTGRSLAASFGEYPNIFPDMMVMLIKSGEDGGRLPDALSEASRQLELQMEIRQKMINAMIYPVFTLIATVGTLVVMLIWIVPVFAKIYKDLNATLPGPTQFLLTASSILIGYGWLVAIIVGAAIVALRRYYRTPEGRMRIDRLKIKAPVFGILYQKSASANLTGSLAGLLDSGVPLIQALETSARVCGNAVLGEAVLGAANNIALGRRLSDELERTELFPHMVTRMIAMAEEVGTLPDVMRQIAATYIEDVEFAIRRVLGIMEPIMVLTVGAIVGFVLVALYFPVFNIGNAFEKGA